MSRIRRRAPVSNHPLTPSVTTAIVLLAMFLLWRFSLKVDMWSHGKGHGTFLFILVPPIVLLMLLYDPITSYLDRRCSRE